MDQGGKCWLVTVQYGIRYRACEGRSWKIVI